MERYTNFLGALLGMIAIVMAGCAPVPGPESAEPALATVPQLVATEPSPTETEVPPTQLPYLSMQEGNNLGLTLLSSRASQDLPDNHIGIVFEDYERYRDTDLVLRNGFKAVRIQSPTDFWDENRIDLKTFNLESIPAAVDQVISEYASNDVKVVLTLWMGAGLRPYGTTFQTQEEIDQYSDYVRFIVSHFKGRIPYYEIWNEPGDMTVRDYANLVRAVLPIIREEDPGAKIIIGAVPGSWENDYPGYGAYQRFSLDSAYLNELLLSGVAPLVDGVSWHPFYDNIPSDPYYQDYPEMLKDIKDLATSQGFTGEYFADELLWKPVSEEGWAGGPPVSPVVAAKYYMRAITLHRGLGVNVTINTFFLEPERENVPQDALSPIHNLANTLAGAEPAIITLSVAGEAPNLMQYAFSLPNRDRLVALWTNSDAAEQDPGVSMTVTLEGPPPQSVIGIDALHGFEQELVVESGNGDIVIRDLLVKDYPLFLHLVY